jgi:hypothetical protein
MENFLGSLIGTIIGAFVTWLVARCYYVRSSNELKSEASELRRLNILMLRGMEQEGWVKLNRDNEGNIKGFVVELSGSVEAVSSGHGKLTVERKKQD